MVLPPRQRPRKHGGNEKKAQTGDQWNKQLIRWLMSEIYNTGWTKRNKQLHPDDGDPSERIELQAQIHHWYNERHKMSVFDQENIFTAMPEILLTKPTREI
jgi:hypothetical protein